MSFLSNPFGNALLVLALAAVVGCWTEVPYAPPEDSEKPSAEEAAEMLPAPVQPEVVAPEPSPPVVEEAPAVAKEQPLPWETSPGQPTEDQAEADRYFRTAATDTAVENEATLSEEEPADQEPEGGGFGSLLEQEYAGLLGDRYAKPQKTPEPVDTTPTAPPMAQDLFGAVAPPQPKTPTPEPEPPAKKTEPRVEKIPVTVPEVVAEELPWLDDLPEESVADAAPSPAVEKPPVVEVLNPPPVAPKKPTLLREVPPRLASLAPLPDVPVRSYNTRHLAWLLGGKLGLARLADAAGATPTEVDQWTRETHRLAQELKVEAPRIESQAISLGQRVRSLLDASAEASEALADRQGPDHAALLEISLKTNALLVLCSEHPELALPTARAVEAAAERANLPGVLWRKVVRTLGEESDPDVLFDAVERLHADVESYLR